MVQLIPRFNIYLIFKTFYSDSYLILLYFLFYLSGTFGIYWSFGFILVGWHFWCLKWKWQGQVYRSHQSKNHVLFIFWYIIINIHFYSICVKSTMPSFKKQEFAVVRQHEEFIWLHNSLIENEEYGGYIVSFFHLNLFLKNLNNCFVLVDSTSTTETWFWCK